MTAFPRVREARPILTRATALPLAAIAIAAALALYDSAGVRIHAPRAPAKVLVNGEERAFEYDASARCVTIDGWNIRNVRILLG